MVEPGVELIAVVVEVVGGWFTVILGLWLFRGSC